jgi:hypothetical protein
MPTWLAITVAVLSILATISTIVSALFISWVTQKGRADFAEFKNEITQTIKTELKEYVTEKRFKEYVDAHDKIFQNYVESHSREVDGKLLEIYAFMTRHRDWKHAMEPWAREVEMKLADLRVDVDKGKEEILKQVDNNKAEIKKLWEEITK